MGTAWSRWKKLFMVCFSRLGGVVFGMLMAFVKGSFRGVERLLLTGNNLAVFHPAIRTSGLPECMVSYVRPGSVERGGGSIFISGHQRPMGQSDALRRSVCSRLHKRERVLVHRRWGHAFHAGFIVVRITRPLVWRRQSPALPRCCARCSTAKGQWQACVRARRRVACAWLHWRRRVSLRAV